MLCDECGIFEIPDNMDCCRVCFSVMRGIPLDDLTDVEFDSFRHRMIKKQKLEEDRQRKKTDRERRAMSTAEEMRHRVEVARQTGEYSGPLQFCGSCKGVIKKTVGYCVPCARKALAAAGIPGHNAK